MRPFRSLSARLSGRRAGAPPAAEDTSPSDLIIARSVRAQAKLRVALSVPIILVTLAALDHLGRFPESAFLMAAGNAAYFTGALAIALRGGAWAQRILSYVTAVLDPIVLSFWMGLLGEFGALFIGFFLFTILGFGFRTGLRHMTLCQAVSVAAFVVVYLVGSYWHEHITVWLGFLITLLSVPLYAAVLIRKLNEARAHAELESQAKSNLLARVSHELRTPLCGIVSAAELISANAADTESGRHSRTILTLSNELLTEINNLLDQSKYEAHALTLSREPVCLHDQADLLHATLDGLARGKGLAFRVLMDPRLPEYVESDAHHLGRVLINLAGNAVKFTDRGEVKVSMELISKAGDLFSIKFAVQDTGAGIPKEYHEKLFSPFYQIHSGRAARGGTGLGLSISQGIVALMGGSLQLDSQPGRGSTFWFEIALPGCAPPPKSSPSTENQPSPTGRRILVVDDHETNLVLLKALLELDEHLVATAGSGQQALDLLARERFDVVFLDFNLGDMNGERVLQLYRFGSSDPCPIYFLTADATSVTHAQLTATGAAGVLTKPVMLEALRQAIAQTAAVQRDAEAATVASVVRRRPDLRPVPVSPIDMDVISTLRGLSDQPGFVANLLEGASADIARNCQELASTITSADHERTRDLAHALKGVCANVGAVRLASFVGMLMGLPEPELDRQGKRLVGELREIERATVSAFRDAIAEETSGSAGQQATFLKTR